MGQQEEAFERFDKQHFIHERKQEYLREATAKYMEYTEQGQSLERAILVAPTHEECDKVTDAVREKLKAAQAIRGSIPFLEQTEGVAEGCFEFSSWDDDRVYPEHERRGESGRSCKDRIGGRQTFDTGQRETDLCKKICGFH